jgi:hypothetical protein
VEHHPYQHLLGFLSIMSEAEMLTRILIILATLSACLGLAACGGSIDKPVVYYAAPAPTDTRDPNIPARAATDTPDPNMPTAIPTTAAPLGVRTTVTGIDAPSPAATIVLAVPVVPTDAPDPAISLGGSMDVVTAFKAAGLEAEHPTRMTPKDYGAAPMLATEGTHIITPSVCADCGGRIMTFATTNDLATVKKYYEDLGKSSALLHSWVYTKGKSLVQLNGSMKPDVAAKYDAALQAMR